MSGNLATVMAARAPNSQTVFLHMHEGQSWSYGDFWSLTARQANAITTLGIVPGDRVAVQVEKSAEALALIMAIMRSGAIALPLNTAYTPSEIDYFLSDAEPAMFVCDPAWKSGYEDAAADVGCNLLTMDAMGEGTLADAARSAHDAFSDHPVSGDELAAILYTSGTTGRSKGAMLTHDNLRSNAEALVLLWRFSERDVLLHALPIFHTHGLFVATNTALMSGGSMIFLPKFDADEVVLNLQRATSMMGVPTFYSRLLAHEGFTGEVARHMRLFVSGSAPLSAETHREFSARTGHAILERYGMTETNMNTSNPYEGERRPGTVGKALPGVEVRIADPDTGAELTQGDVGVIEVKGPNVFAGYWRNPAKTAEEFRADGCFITGDLAREDEDGYIHIVGRGKDLIISGGFNVYPAEVETIIDELPGVAESALIGLPHPDFGEGVTAIVAPRPGAQLFEADMLAALKPRLAAFKRPKRIFVVEALPRNTMGKVQKNQLRQAYAGTYQ